MGYRDVKILGLLQNLWLKDPGKHACRFEGRNRLNLLRYALYNSTTGRKLRTHFQKDCFDYMIWEESTRAIGSSSGSVFPPDPEHILNVILENEIEVVVAFGEVAKQGLLACTDALADHAKIIQIVYGPHPAKRGCGAELSETWFKMEQACCEAHNQRMVDKDPV